MERIRLVLAHECAHIRRWDYLGQVAAHLACAIYWFHPLVWWAKRQLTNEREAACDDEVLNMDSSPIEYAAHLLAIARGARNRNEPPTSIAAARSNLERRLRLILAPGVNRRPLSRPVLLGAVGCAFCALVPLAAIHAQSPMTGTLAGIVRDPSGAVIPNAMITATNAEARNVEAGYADAAGRFELKSLPPGPYTIEVRGRGFAIFRQSGLIVGAGDVARVQATLDVGAINETIEVVARRPASDTSAQTAPERIRVGGNVQASKLLTKVNPAYPSKAQQNGVTGTVILRAVIGVDGRLLSLTPAGTSPDPELITAALDAVRLWTYQPTLLNGQPVEVVTTITVNFRLE